MAVGFLSPVEKTCICRALWKGARSLVGANPSQQLSLRLVAARAVHGVTTWAEALWREGVNRPDGASEMGTARVKPCSFREPGGLLPPDRSFGAVTGLRCPPFSALEIAGASISADPARKSTARESGLGGCFRSGTD